MRNKAKPFYGRGEHSLWADTVGVSSILQGLTLVYKYDGIFSGHTLTIERASYRNHLHSIEQMMGFLDRVQDKFNFSAKVAEMFTRPNGAILH
jgi:hypothetical protein